VIVGGLLYWLWSATPRLWPEPSGISAPAISAERARIVKYDISGKKLWELEARAVQTTERESTAEEVVLRFFDDEGQETLTVHAPKARLSADEIALLGPVRAHGSEFSLTTEDLFWEGQKLWTPSVVRIEREDFLLTGRGFEYFEGRATILHEARLTLRSRTEKRE